MKPILVYVDCRDTREAEDIGRELLEKKLVACVNIIPSPIKSLYLWPPKSMFIEDAKEILLIAKTLDEKWDEIEKTVMKIHSYDVPGILAIPLTRVSRIYLAWMKKEIG
jgi:periplasmic divalent cation tolerance protein